MSRKKTFRGDSIMSAGNIPIIASIIVLVAFIAGLMIGSLVAVKAYSGSAPVSISGGSFAQGYAAAKKKLADSGAITYKTSSLSGQITKINGQKISFSTALVNSLDDESLKNRIADVDDNTEIILYRLKSADTLAADQKEAQTEMKTLQEQREVLHEKINQCGQAASQASKDCLETGVSYDYVTQQIVAAEKKMGIYEEIDNALITDLKEGMNITVIAQKVKASVDSKPLLTVSFENIAENPEFIAGTIQAREVNNSVAPVAAPAPITQ
jgi:hypothetical protein